MAESYVKIGAEGIDVEDIIRQIRERADVRRKSGEFDLDAIARAERYNITTIKDNADFFDRYLSCLCLVNQVDINDFEIIEHRARFAPLLKKFKKGIWSVLRFYTYHLWSQQNQINNLINAAISIVAQRDGEQLKKMQDRVDELEARLAKLEGGKGA